MNMHWRITGPPRPLAAGYIDAVDVEFSRQAVQHVDTIGNRIAREFGDIRLASRRVQEIETRKPEPQARHTDSLLQNHTTLRGQISQLRKIAALPFFRGKPP